jgi:hypothetical protein
MLARARQKKENILNVKQVIRVAVCAAIVALSVASAGSLLAQSVAGQEASESPAVAHQYESRSVKWVPGFSILHHFQCCLSQGLDLCWLCFPGPRL